MANMVHSVIGYCTLRNNPDVFQAIKDQNNGLRDVEAVNIALAALDYITVLNALWSETDAEKKLSWLRENTGMHAPLLYERGLAELEADPSPSVETAIKVSYVFLLKGRFRTAQDSQCVNDISAHSANQNIHMTYSMAFVELRSEKLNSEIGDYCKKNAQEILELQKNTIRSIAEESIRTSSTLPSPRWVAEHGLKNLVNRLEKADSPLYQWMLNPLYAFCQRFLTPIGVVLVHEPNNLHPESQWVQTRERFANDKLAELDRM